MRPTIRCSGIVFGAAASVRSGWAATRVVAAPGASINYSSAPSWQQQQGHDLRVAVPVQARPYSQDHGHKPSIDNYEILKNAVQSANKDVFFEMLSLGTDPCQKDDSGSTLLYQAVINDNDGCEEIALAIFSAYPNPLDAFAKNPGILATAVLFNKKLVVERFLEDGCDLNQKINIGGEDRGLLWLAVINKNGLDMVKMLLQEHEKRHAPLEAGDLKIALQEAKKFNLQDIVFELRNYQGPIIESSNSSQVKPSSEPKPRGTGIIDDHKNTQKGGR